MNERQQKYKHNRLILGMRPLPAALAAGYSRKTALVKSYRMDKSVGMVGIQEALEAAGLTDKTLALHAAEGLKATKVQSCDIYVQMDANGKPKFNDSMDFIDVPDWPTRHRYFHTICEITKRINTQPLIDNRTLQITLITPNGRLNDNRVTRISI